MSTTEEIFKSGLNHFRARLSTKENTEIQLTTHDELKRKIAEIQRQQELNKNTMNMRRIEKFLEGMGQLSKVVEVFLNANEIVCFIWGPIKLLLVAAAQHMDAFDSLLDAYKELGLSLPQLEQYGDMFKAPEYEDLRTLLAQIYCEILTFHTKSMRFFQAKGPTKAFRALWKDHDFEFKDTLRSIRLYRDTIAHQFVIYSTREARGSQSEVRANVQRCLDYNKELKRKFEKTETDRKNDEMIKVQEWIKASIFTEEHHQKFRDQRLEFEHTDCKDTGRWIVDKGHVHDWIKDRSTDHTMIWINGKKGAGKSFLASIIIDECMKEVDAGTSYFYCHENEADTDLNTADAVFRGLLSQLAHSYPDLAPCLFAKRAASKQEIQSKEVKGLLELFFEKRQYIIIDGIDECKLVERKQIVQFFADKAARNQIQGDGKLRVMFVSQSLVDIRKALQAPGINPCIIDLRADDRFIALDIGRFVDLRVEAMQSKFKDIRPNELDLIRSSCKNPKSHEGMFLFVHLVTENLLHQPTLADLLQEAKENFPTSLSKAYERIMKRLKRELSDPSPRLWERAVQLLSWMACAKRPMKWNEMQAVMSLSENAINYRLYSLREDASKLCGSFVHILRGGRLEFIHSTAKEFLLDPENADFNRWDVEIELTIRCLDYLTFDCFSKNLDEAARRKYAQEGQYSLQDYAISKWMHHLYALMQAMNSPSYSNSLHYDSDNRPKMSWQREQEFTRVLRKFANTYHDGLMPRDFETEEQNEKRERNEKEAENECDQFKEEGFYDDLRLIWTHARVHEGASRDIRNEVSIPDLLGVLTKNRGAIQELMKAEGPAAGRGQTPPTSQPLAEYYGNRPFKCNLVTCDYFWEGLDTSSALKVHEHRHTRPFECVVESCSIGKFGFPSSKDRERHVKTYHPEHPDAGPSPFPQLNRRKVGEAKFSCQHCDKSFTRQINLQSHVLSHFGERPHSCGTCGRSFTRINDRRRHEKIHTRRVR